ncbi:hypothetical protein PG993_011376 [Apiospora rasikravindrae]|uniref:Rhodopsin domain-containing protein n=1 Tax=Apiospora rasikravindrae TaxID=990691 RepID=A0ABR1SE31_9PEZI
MSLPMDLCAVPAGTAPDGSWDLVHFESLETASIIIFVLLTVLAMLFVVPRIYVNRKKLLMADSSIFLLYWQLFHVHDGPVRAAIWIGLVFTFLTAAPTTIFSIALDTPRKGEEWQDVLVRLSAPTSLYDYALLGPIQGSVIVALDIFAFVLPLPIIARLNLTPRKKKQLLLLFSTAFLGIVASIVALVYKVRLLTLQKGNPGNVMWLQGPTYICVHAESIITIIVGSMPAFSNFMKLHVLESRAFQALRSRFGASGRSTGEKSGESPAPPVRPLHGTIGSPSTRMNRPAYYQLTDTMILSSRYTADGGEDGEAQAGRPGQIFKTMDVRQEVRDQDGRSADSRV